MKRNLIVPINHGIHGDSQGRSRQSRWPSMSLNKNCPFLIGIAVLLVVGVSGCVSSGTHKETLTELKEARRSAALQAQADKTTKDQLYTELVNAQEKNRQREEQIRQITESSEQVRLDRDGLKTQLDDLERKLETAKQDLARRAEVLDKTLARVGSLSQKEQDLNQALSATRGEVRELTIKLDAERAQVAALQEDKQQLLGGTTTAQSEIARLQKRAGELETEAARVKDLEKQLAERDQEIGQLGHRVADHDEVAAALASQKEEAKSTRERVDQLTAELATMGEESAALTRERDKLIEQVTTLEDEVASLKQSNEQALASLDAQQAELARAQGEKAAKEEEINRLTGTYEDLETSLRSEIAQGDIKIKQVRDRLTINVVDRILFDSGSAKIKPEGLKVLKTVGDVLMGGADKQIRVDGHTDNVPISARLKDRFPSNWELSTARATSVVRYLIDDVGIAPELLTASGHADTQPVAGNDSEEGRTHNRRIEIALYPKDLRDIAEAITSE